MTNDVTNMINNTMNAPENFDFSISQCDMSDIFTEVSRFMYHILLIHVITYTMDRKDELFGAQLFKTLFATALAVIIYHIFFKKIMNAKLKNIQSTCNASKEYTDITNKSNEPNKK